MIRLLLATVVIGATLADTAQNGLAETITWKGGEKMASWSPFFSHQDNLENERPSPSKSSYVATRTAIYKNYAFLAYPRSKSSDVPITLARMNLAGNEHIQYPFPDLEMQEIDNCKALQDVIDIFIDIEGLLWVLDAGDSHIKVVRKSCKPKIIAFDAATGEEVVSVDLSNFEGHQLFQHVVVDYNGEDHAITYVSDTINRQIFVISGRYCRQTLRLPDLYELNVNLNDITLNLVRNGTSSLLFINDERSEQMYYLRTWDVRSCSELPGDLLRTIGHNNRFVILGNDDRGNLYYRENTNTAVVYKYNALGGAVDTPIAYRGDPSALAHQVVPDYMSGGVRLLLSNTTIENLTVAATNSLVLI